MNIQRRLEALEQREAGGDCELCKSVETRVIVPRADGEKWEETDRVSIARNCPKCGRAREIILRVVTARCAGRASELKAVG